MAYPGEKENLEYLNYVEDMASKGEEPLQKDEWRKKIKNADNKQIPTALSEY